MVVSLQRDIDTDNFSYYSIWVHHICHEKDADSELPNSQLFIRSDKLQVTTSTILFITTDKSQHQQLVNVGLK